MIHNCIQNFQFYIGLCRSPEKKKKKKDGQPYGITIHVIELWRLLFRHLERAAIIYCPFVKVVLHRIWLNGYTQLLHQDHCYIKCTLRSKTEPCYFCLWHNLFVTHFALDMHLIFICILHTWHWNGLTKGGAGVTIPRSFPRNDWAWYCGLVGMGVLPVKG